MTVQTILRHRTRAIESSLHPDVVRRIAARWGEEPEDVERLLLYVGGDSQLCEMALRRAAELRCMPEDWIQAERKMTGRMAERLADEAAEDAREIDRQIRERER